MTRGETGEVVTLEPTFAVKLRSVPRASSFADKLPEGITLGSSLSLNCQGKSPTFSMEAIGDFKDAVAFLRIILRCFDKFVV